MALDREATFQEAERQLRQGRLSQALVLFRQLADDSPRDLLMLNRIGDLLARVGRTGEAIGYYERIADRFVEAGFLPRAIAILKKILKLDPSRTHTLVRLGQLYLRQRLAGEARVYLLRAADRYLESGQFTNARRVFETLVGAEPQEPLHRVRLGEAKAAEGDPKGAAEELRAAVGAFERAGRRQEAEATRRRLLELLEGASRRRPSDTDLLVELLVEYEKQGRESKVAALLGETGAAFSLDALERWARARMERCGTEISFDLLEPILREWARSGDSARAEDLLDRLSRAGAGDRALGPLRVIVPGGRPSTESVPSSPPGGPPAPGGSAFGRDEEELVAGFLTEAEVFEKYGLLGEAVRQLREAAARFPEHVAIQERLAGLLRAQGDKAGWAEAMCGVALARKAAGDVEGARQAASEAAREGGLPPSRLAALREAGLLEPEPPALEPKEEPDTAVRAEAEEGEEEVEIVFEEPTAAVPAFRAASDAASGRPRGERIPDPELVEEISLFLEQGKIPEALEKIRALRTLGFRGAALDALEARARESRPAEPAAPASAAGDSGLRLDEEELESLSAMLEAELEAIEGAGSDASPGREQSLEDVFAAFKQHVAREVDEADHQTHYDLGIAYREMGLLEDAMEEFRKASESPILRRQASSMLGLCYRERRNFVEAARWFREALAAAQGPGDRSEGLRYELAETLLASGDARGALDLFLEVFRADPTYRDVGTRVAELRARLGS